MAANSKIRQVTESVVGKHTVLEVSSMYLLTSFHTLFSGLVFLAKSARIASLTNCSMDWDQWWSGRRGSLGTLPGDGWAAVAPDDQGHESREGCRLLGQPSSTGFLAID